MAACPYDAIFINPEDHSAEKCNFCAHRLDVGLEPACVVGLPDRGDPRRRPERPGLAGRAASSSASRSRCGGRRRRPRPSVFYNGAHQATLDPLAARRPDGGLFAWASRPGRPAGTWPPGTLADGTSSARGAARPTTCRTRRRGTGGSACTRGPRASPPAPISVPAAARPGRLRSLGRPGGPLGGAAAWRWPSSRVTGGAADRGPQASGPLLPDLHPASVAELAGPRRVHHRRLRRRVLALHLLAAPGWRGRGSAAVARRDRAAARVATAVLHRVPVRAGQGARSLAEPAAAAAPAGAGRAGRRGRAAAVRRLAASRRGAAALAERAGRRGRAHVLLVPARSTLPHVTAHAHLADCRDDPRAVRAVLLGRGSPRCAVAVAAPWIGAGRRAVRAGGPARPRARVRPGRPVGAAGVEAGHVTTPR